MKLEVITEHQAAPMIEDYSWSEESRFDKHAIYCKLRENTENSSKVYFEIEDLLSETIEDLYQTFEMLYHRIASLYQTIEAKSYYIKMHSQRVAELSYLIANQMDLNDIRIEPLYKAAMLHDIGKIGIEDYILNKKGPLTILEFDRIKEHSEIGVKLLEQVDNFKEVGSIVRYHHVYYNGRGYPTVPSGIHVPIEAYIVGVADAYDAMTSNRPYRKALSEFEAIKRIYKAKGEQFHPDVVDAFFSLKDTRIKQ